MSKIQIMTFPPGCVESTQPLMMKRRKHTKVDVQPVEGWRLVMALRSGLIVESTWALDVLNILLFDDNAFTYFGLGNLPGLFEALMEHWRASLISMFGITEDLEIGSDRLSESRTRKRAHIEEKEKKMLWYEKRSVTDDDALFHEDAEEFELGIADKFDAKDKVQVLHAGHQDFTKRPRFSDEDVEIEAKEDELFISDAPRAWDPETNKEGSYQHHIGSDHWLQGGGNTTNHIVTHFAGDVGLVQFVRLLKETAPPKEIKKEGAEEVVAGDDKNATKKVIVNGVDELKSENADQETATDEAAVDHDNKSNDEPPEDIIDKIKRLTGIVLRDPEMARKRWADESLEDECYMRDESSLNLVTDTQNSIGRRAVCISTILRNLSFVPGNECELSSNPAFLTICGRLLLLFHWYPPRTTKQRNYDRSDEDDLPEKAASVSESLDSEWWWDYLHVIRENMMVILANIAGSLELNRFDEVISRPILDGLLEWAVSSSSYAQDPFPYVGPTSSVSPQRLAIEALCKLCLHEANVDLILTTPPYSRISKLTRLLAKKLYRYEDQVLREFSINVLYYLSSADSGVARTIATADQTVGLLLGFIEQAEQNAMVVAQQHGVNALRDNPDSMGTSLDMLRRAASTLNNLSRHPDNIPLFVKHEQRFLSLVMSQILDQGVAAILSNVLFNIGDQQSKETKKKEREEAETAKLKKESEEKDEEKKEKSEEVEDEKKGEVDDDVEMKDVEASSEKKKKKKVEVIKEEKGSEEEKGKGEEKKKKKVAALEDASKGKEVKKDEKEKVSEAVASS